jgi:hypothetical protein
VTFGCVFAALSFHLAMRNTKFLAAPPIELFSSSGRYQPGASGYP